MESRMTALEMVGRTKQATKTAREALDTHTIACTPEAHASVVTALKAQMDIADAQSEYFANGQSDSIATLVAQKMEEKMAEKRQENRKVVAVNGREFAMPSPTAVWRTTLFLTVLISGMYTGCEAKRTAPTAAVAQTAPVAQIAAVAPARPMLDPATVQLLREMIVSATRPENVVTNQ